MRALLPVFGILCLAGCQSESSHDRSNEGEPTASTQVERPLITKSPHPAPKGMVWIPGGNYMMGSDVGLPDEAPIHEIELDGFWMDMTEVTNAQFAEFVKETGYVTVAEQKPDPKDFPGTEPALLVPGALVLVKGGENGHQWQYVRGASWRHPDGPQSTIQGKDDHPVVNVCWEDAFAFAQWAKKSLPTEAQFEFAARSGDSKRTFVWKGNEMQPNGQYMANTWQGEFPKSNSGADNFLLTSPVASFPANDFGLYDMAGNVWEWCADWYRPDGYALRMNKRNPTGPEDSYDPQEPGSAKKVVRGGSFLCSSNSCAGYRPTARMKSSMDTGLFHTGFRCVINIRPN